MAEVDSSSFALYTFLMEEHKKAELDRVGLYWGIASYFMWGFFPIYWKLLQKFNYFEILTHRIIWSFVFYSLILLPQLKNFSFKTIVTKREVLLSILAGILLSINWGLYIYAVNAGHILEGSLAYFINPILNVGIGVVFFREAFPWPMRLAVLFAGLGIAYKISFIAGFPWISLTLALTFCLYGVTKKLSKIPVRISSVLESSAGLIPAIYFAQLFYSRHNFEVTPLDWVLLVGGGAVTGLPLFLFSFAAQRIPYSVLGMLQFIAPSLQFIVGVWLFNEELTSANLVAFSLIWIAVAFYLTGSLIRFRRQ